MLQYLSSSKCAFLFYWCREVVLVKKFNKMIGLEFSYIQGSLSSTSFLEILVVAVIWLSHVMMFLWLSETIKLWILQGLRFLTEGKEDANVIHKPVLAKEIAVMAKPVEEKTKAAAAAKTRVHRAFPGGISWVRDVPGLS